MQAIQTTYFDLNPLKRDTRSGLSRAGILLAAAGAVLVLQSLRYATRISVLLQTWQGDWAQPLALMLRTMLTWAVVLGAVYAIRFVIQPDRKYGSEFWKALGRGFALGVALPFLLSVGAGLLIYIPLGLLSLFIVELLPYASLQFACLAGAIIVLIWIAVGLPPLLAGMFREGRWYYKVLAVLLLLQLTLDVLQVIVSSMRVLVENSVWQANDTALLVAVLGSLLVTVAAVLWSLRGQPLLTIVYAIAGIYTASVVSGNFSERLFGWGEIPAAVVAVLAPLAWLQLVKWLLRRDGTVLAGLAAGFTGLLAGLFVIALLHLQISGQGWISLVCGIMMVLALGLILGVLLTRRVTKWLAGKYHLPPVIVRSIDLALIAGIMAGMFVGGFLAR